MRKVKPKMRNGSPPFDCAKAATASLSISSAELSAKTGLRAELHHAQHAAAARREVGRLDDVPGVDRQKRQAARAQDRTEGGDQRFRLAPRRLVVDDDAARALAGRAARAHDERRFGRALELHLLEQADRNPGNLGDVAVGLQASPGGVEDTSVFRTLLIVMARKLVQAFEEDRFLLGLPQRIGRGGDETFKHGSSP